MYREVSIPEIPDICDLDDAVELKKVFQSFLLYNESLPNRSC